MGACPPSAP